MHNVILARRLLWGALTSWLLMGLRTTTQVLSMLGSIEGQRIVELGAGIGRFTGELARTARAVLAVGPGLGHYCLLKKSSRSSLGRSAVQRTKPWLPAQQCNVRHIQRARCCAVLASGTHLL